tara:strand:+ start:1049 stop:2245 length:1197 start_codon:yes stop_codon:yes gene_type:complete
MKNNIFYNDKVLHNFGLQPISNRFKKYKKENSPLYNLSISICKNTGLIFSKYNFPIKELKPKYTWITCYEPEKHLDKLVSRVIKLFKGNKKINILGLTFKDQSTINRLKNKNYDNANCLDFSSYGINDNFSNIETLQSKFNIKNAKKIVKNYGSQDLVIFRHVLEHIYNLDNFFKFIKNITIKNGYVIIEVPSCTKNLLKGDCTMIWEEHKSYFTKESLKSTINFFNLNIIDIFEYKYTHENCLVAIIKNTNSNKVFNYQKSFKINTELLIKFVNQYDKRKAKIHLKIKKLKEKYGKLFMYGAGHFSIAFISLNNIAKDIEIIIDDNIHKKGMFLPIGNIKIMSSKYLKSKKNKICLLSINPDNHNKVLNKHKILKKNNIIFKSIFPSSKNSIDSFIC